MFTWNRGISKTQLSCKGGGPSCSKLGWCKQPDKSLSRVIHLLRVNLLCGSESMAQLLYKTLRLTIFLDKWQKVPGKNNDKKYARVLIWMVKISNTQKVIPRKKRICFFCCLLQGHLVSHNKIITYFFVITSFTTRYTSKITLKAQTSRWMVAAWRIGGEHESELNLS